MIETVICAAVAGLVLALCCPDPNRNSVGYNPPPVRTCPRPTPTYYPLPVHLRGPVGPVFVKPPGLDVPSPSVVEEHFAAEIRMGIKTPDGKMKPPPWRLS